ncbi:hypothetical protein [Streptomyces sp. NBC_01276]|uniref:hypothetical protein n=1 Tax=Streptomyces sp. NBC_01276 TaxID=2903808 RepID=UPI00352C65E2
MVIAACTDSVLDTNLASWTSWRGRAVEPVIRESLWRLADDRLPEGTHTNDPEIDIIGADRAPIAKKITVMGSIKWLESEPFDHRDLARLITTAPNSQARTTTPHPSRSPAATAPPKASSTCRPKTSSPHGDPPGGPSRS